MGLTDEATRAANTAAVEAAAKRATNERTKGLATAERLTETFGLEFEWLERIEEYDYHQQHRNFGGSYWEQRRIVIDRFQVDDIQLGLQLNISGRAGLVLWKPCPRCGQRRMFRLDYVSRIGDDVRGNLVRVIGKVLTGDKPCTYCAAQPCECCGRTN